MANKMFGEARLTLADGRELTVRFDFNALLEAEEAADTDTDAMIKAVAKGNPRLKIARAMLYGALRYHHSEITLEDAGDLFMSDSEAVSEAMGAAMQEMADRRAQNPSNGAARAASRLPRGIGTRSLKSGAKAA